jgi:hypothetical protein
MRFSVPMTDRPARHSRVLTEDPAITSQRNAATLVQRLPGARRHRQGKRARR